MVDKLLPCPSCGGRAVLDYPPSLRVCCVNNIHMSGCLVQMEEADSTEEAIAAWNRRARTPLETDLLAACEAAELVIEQSYEVNDYPANGESQADEVLVILRAAIDKAKGEQA